MGACIYTALFAPCAFGDMAAMAPPGAFPGAGSCIGACCLQNLLPGLLNCMAHTGLRNAYGIQGDCCGDCVAGCFCTPCSICQQNREVQIRRAASAGQTGAGMAMMAPTQVVVNPVQYVQAPAPQVVYAQQPQVVYAQQPQVMYAQPQPQMVVYR